MKVAAQAAGWVLWDPGSEVGHLTSGLELYHLAVVRFNQCLVSRVLNLGDME